MTTEKSHFINNKWIEGTGSAFRSTDPASGHETWTGRAAQRGEIDQAMDAATTAFVKWADLTSDQRIKYLKSFGQQVSTHSRELAEIISRETGKPLWEALEETEAMVAKISVSIEAYFNRCQEVTGSLKGARTVVRFKPHGVVAVIGPFNLPGHLPNGHIVPAILAGNTVVLKPSSQTPLVAQRMVELWEAADLPKGVLNMIQGGRETGAGLISHPKLDGLYFTGSYATGHALHTSLAGHPEKILALEMGGNNPLVAHEVSDVNAAAYVTILSAFITSGQRCTCARRLIVPEGEAGDEFINHLIILMNKIRVGPYTDAPEPFMGPVISEAAASSLLSAQEHLLAEGAQPLLAMQRLRESGAFLTPGLVNVTPVKDRPDVELFGPFLQLIRVANFEEAILEANHTAYGLAAGLLSDSADLYRRFLHGVRAGVINWNRQITGASGKMPFGGVKGSGNHRPSGYYAVDYCSYPVASIEQDHVEIEHPLLPGIDL